MKQAVNGVKFEPERVWEFILPCAPCPSLAHTAKLFLTASKLVLTSCSHDTLRLFYFSADSWLSLWQLEILPPQLHMTQKPKSLPPLPTHDCTACPLTVHVSAIKACRIFLWSLSAAHYYFPPLHSLVLCQRAAISHPRCLLWAYKSQS